MRIGNRQFVSGTHVMAIINLTPDSFYAPSRVAADGVLFSVERAINEGAEIIDIGPQSTRPGHTRISSDEEIERFLSPLEKIKERFDIPVSLDTFYAKSARIALEAGADMINDIWGLSFDEEMASTIAEFDASVCIMHNSVTPVTDLFGEVETFLRSAAEKALKAGIDKDKICLDGGICFAKDAAQNFELLNGYERIARLGYPALLGCSRKSMFGGKAEDRLRPTLEATKLAVRKGIMFVRVHDVKENVAAIEEETERIRKETL